MNPWVPGAPYRVTTFDTDPTTGYALVDSCSNWLNGAIKLDYKWFITREILVIGTERWEAMKQVAWEIMAEKFPSYNPDTLFKETRQGVSEGCQYTPCTGIEVGLTNCPA